MELKDINIKELLSDKTRMAFFALILVILVYLFVFLAPGIKTFFINLTKASKLKAKISKIERDWANVGSLEKKISDFNEKIDYYEKKLPGGKEVPQVLAYLSDAARKLDVKITEIKPIERSEEEEGKSRKGQSLIYHSVPIFLKAECGYHQLGRFLNQLERADRFMKIGDIKIRSSSRNVNIHSVQLTVVTYTMEK